MGMHGFDRERTGLKLEAGNARLVAMGKERQ